MGRLGHQGAQLAVGQLGLDGQQLGRPGLHHQHRRRAPLAHRRHLVGQQAGEPGPGPRGERRAVGPGPPRWPASWGRHDDQVEAQVGHQVGVGGRVEAPSR